MEKGHSEQETYRYRDLYQDGVRALEGNPDARLDARILLEEVCGTDLQTLLVYPDKEVTPEQAARYLEWIGRRAAHEPTAYIIGHQEFMGLDFKVTNDVLIPEQDTEKLIELVIAAFENGKLRPHEGRREIRILDLCTGSGCILLSTLHYLKEAAAANPETRDLKITGVGTDLSPAALAIARENAGRLGLEDSTEFYLGDLYGALDQEEGAPFDLILSNPPYIRTDVIPTLPEEVKSGEPYMALDGGEDGLIFYRRILREGTIVRDANSIIMVEIGYDQAQDVTDLFLEAGFACVTVYKDYGGNDRVVVAY